MPGPLPPTSGYTYAVELSVDEATAVGASRVDFSHSLPFYVDNFLNFPVGEPVPAGFYDRQRAVWVSSDNSRIIDLLDISSQGLAELDIDGSGHAATAQVLADLGVSDAERQQLAQLNAPSALAFDTAGRLYLTDRGNQRIRRIDPGGIITTVAGVGGRGLSDDGGPAVHAALAEPNGIVVDEAGYLYIADLGDHRVRRVGPDGIITTVAGTGVAGFSGDGGAATEAQLHAPSGVALDHTGHLYIADRNNDRIRRVSPDGIITTVAGSGRLGPSVEGHPAVGALVNAPVSVAVDPYGRLYLAEVASHVRLITSAFGAYHPEQPVLASRDGQHLFQFDAQGRHLYTFDTTTGAALYTFRYIDRGALVEIEDVDGDVTRIERDGAGRPQAIIAADGQRTALTLDAHGYLASVTNSPRPTPTRPTGS